MCTGIFMCAVFNIILNGNDLSNSNGQLNSKPFNSIWLTLNSNSLGVNYGCADLIKEMVYQGVEINTDYTELKFTSIWFLLF